MGVETLADLLAITQGLAILGALVSGPLQLWACNRFGRRRTITFLLSLLGSIFVVSAFIPFDAMPELIYLVAPFLGACASRPRTPPPTPCVHAHAPRLMCMARARHAPAGVCLSIPNVIPDAILGDIIDYDQLLTGQRSEAM